MTDTPQIPPANPVDTLKEKALALAERLITPELLDKAVQRANESFDAKGNLNLHLRKGENAFMGDGMVGFRSKDFTILAVDTNHNGKFNDPNDKVLISAGGSVLVSNVKGDKATLLESPELEAKIRAAGAKIGSTHSAADGAVGELGKLAHNAIKSANLNASSGKTPGG